MKKCRGRGSLPARFRFGRARAGSEPLPLQSYFRVARPTVRAAFGVERSAAHAAIVHLAREQVGDDRAHNENAAENNDAQQRISQPLYFSLKPC